LSLRFAQYPWAESTNSSETSEIILMTVRKTSPIVPLTFDVTRALLIWSPHRICLQ